MKASNITLRRAFAAIILAMASGAPSLAQTLDLSNAGQDPPAIAESSHASMQVGVLEKQIADLIAAQRGADATLDLVLRASINLRIIAADMLAAGDGAAPARLGSPLVLAGLTLAARCADVDRSLRKLVELRDRASSTPDALSEEDGRRYRVASMALTRFNDLAVQRAQDVKQTDLEQFDASLASIIAPLGEAIALLEGAALANHWIAPPRASGSARALQAPREAQATTVDQLLARAHAADLSDVARTDIVRSLRSLGESPKPEDRFDLETARGRMEDALQFAEALGDARWIAQADREMYMQRLEQALLLQSEPSTRERGVRHLARLESSRRVIAIIDELDRRDMDIATLRDAMLIADALIDNPQDAARGAQLLDRLHLVAERMRAYRLIEAGQPSSDLAAIRRQLDRNYQQAEQSLLQAIAEIAADDEAVARPEFSSLVMNQQQYLEDLRRVDLVPRWLETARLIRPQAAGALGNQCRRLCQWLLDVNRRPDAVLAMDQLAQQFELFYPLPFESELRAGDVFVVEATGAQQAQLVRAIDEQRQRWIFALSRGDGSGSDANRMLLLYRLMRTMSDVAALRAMGADGSLLNRWSAWELGADVSSRAAADLPTRLKLAAAAAVAGDDAALREQLDRIDTSAPLVKLVGRLSSLAGASLASLPDGAAGLCGQLAFPPRDEAWMINQRVRLAGLCRYAMELEHARMRGDQPLTDALTLHVNAVAGDLLDQLGERRDPLPTLVGFDAPDDSPQETKP
jgi:hypothetical protein